MTGISVSTLREDRLKRARISLEGLALGDAFGDRWFFTARHITPFVPVTEMERVLPARPWDFTDDTQMALSIVSILRQHDGIDQDALAENFGANFDPKRGYGPAMYHLLPQLRGGFPWKQAAYSLFNGKGSFGNGSAMRVAPLGAYFADDLTAACSHAAGSAEVTHAHPEAIAGATAVAAAAAIASRLKAEAQLPSRADYIDLILPLVPPSEVRGTLVTARDLPTDTKLIDVVQALGNGSGISAQDTVAFTLWSAGENLGNYEEAMWLTVAASGDIDTNCAIVGGIVASYTGLEGIPSEWLKRRERLPDWPFDE